ncbi:MAG: hypothetical protein ACR2F1_03085 [Nitrososphaeraceae archaeon]
MHLCFCAKDYNKHILFDTHMDLSEYILQLYRTYKKFSDPGEAAKQLLPMFAERNCVTTYQCYKELNKAKKIAYKNVHKRVKKLYELGILKEVSNNGPTKHGSIYYKLSSFGIYCIFLIGKINSLNLDKLIENYPNDGLLEYFLYQFIEKKTVKGIKSYIILGYIFEFLKDCCISIESLLKHLPQIEKDRGYSTCITVTDNLINPELADYWFGGSNSFVEYLKKRFKIKWVDKNTSKINYNKSESLINIVEKNKTLLLKLDTKNKKAILSEKENILFEFELEEIGENSFAINEFVPTTVKERLLNIPYFENEKYQSSINLCMKILKYANFKGGEGKLDNFLIMNDLKLLSKDQIFRNNLKQIKNNFDNNFHKFENLYLT